jgi:antitoxin VapB
VSIAVAKRASIFRGGANQAVRLPQKLRFPADVKEVRIRKQGDGLFITPVKPNWSSFFAPQVNVPDSFRKTVKIRRHSHATLYGYDIIGPWTVIPDYARLESIPPAPATQSRLPVFAVRSIRSPSSRCLLRCAGLLDSGSREKVPHLPRRCLRCDHMGRNSGSEGALRVALTDN